MSIQVTIYRLNGVDFPWRIVVPPKPPGVLLCDVVRQELEAVTCVPPKFGPNWDDLRLVATVNNADGADLVQILDDAWKMNTTDGNWWDEDVVVRVRGHMWTSDVIIFADRVYRIDGDGFARVQVCSAHLGIFWLVCNRLLWIHR